MEKTKVLVGLASCGIAAGANKVYEKLLALQETNKLDIEIKKTGCIGMCYREPLVEIIDETGSYLYGEIDEVKAVDIFDKHLKQSEPIKDYIVRSDFVKTKDDTFWDGQVKIALRNCGVIDPENIQEYENNDGYKAIRNILEGKIDREKVIQTVLDSGIRGRGGGGFPTGLKWRFAQKNDSDQKYIICNADEGDPGAFMDRSLLEGDPHAVIEGLAIGAYAIGASEGVIYCRAEYPLAIKRLNIAINQAKEKGYLGNDIMGVKGFNFNLYVKEGAGAFVCGEETALLASIEG